MAAFKMRHLNKNTLICPYEEQKFETYKATGLLHAAAVPGLQLLHQSTFLFTIYPDTHYLHQLNSFPKNTPQITDFY